MTPVLLQGAVWGYVALCDSSSLYFVQENTFLNVCGWARHRGGGEGGTGNYDEKIFL